MTTKRFHLGDLLSVTTDKLLSPTHMDGLYAILRHMTSGPVFTHELGIAADRCRPALLAQFPFLADFDPAGLTFDSPAKVMPWLDEQVAIHGEYFDVEPLS